MQTPAFTITSLSRSARPLVLAALAMLVAAPALAQHAHSHPATTPAQAPPAFVASTAKPFAQLMDDAMAVMDHGMRAAPMNGDPDHDFVTMMIPHHQGAIDMAKALLDAKADPHATCGNGNKTPIEIATINRKAALVELLQAARP